MLQEHDGVLKTSGSVSLEAFKMYYVMGASPFRICCKYGISGIALRLEQPLGWCNFFLFEYSCAKLALVHKNVVFHPYGM